MVFWMLAYRWAISKGGPSKSLWLGRLEVTVVVVTDLPAVESFWSLGLPRILYIS